MIRCIDLGNQINEWEHSFCFFSTVTEEFIKVGVDSIFDSEADLIEAFDGDCGYKNSEPHKARLLRLIPDKFKKVNEVES
jgi:hypothetical protein